MSCRRCDRRILSPANSVPPNARQVSAALCIVSIITQVDANTDAALLPSDEKKGGTHIVSRALVITM
jgi:hypothetical protein